MNGRPAVRPEVALDPSLVPAEADGGIPCCGNCAHARVIPDVRPMEWRCRGGHPFGGLVYRGDSGALSQTLHAPRRCREYRAMGADRPYKARRRRDR